MALEFLPPVTAARLFAKDKYLEPMFGDAGQARTKAAMLLLTIATTLSRTCTKPLVMRCFYFHSPADVTNEHIIPQNTRLIIKGKYIFVLSLLLVILMRQKSKETGIVKIASQLP